jgi:hypothetical protein
MFRMDADLSFERAFSNLTTLKMKTLIIINEPFEKMVLGKNNTLSYIFAAFELGHEVYIHNLVKILIPNFRSMLCCLKSLAQCNLVLSKIKTLVGCQSNVPQNVNPVSHLGVKCVRYETLVDSSMSIVSATPSTSR